MPATPDDKTCRGTIGAATVERVRVPVGAYCLLAGTTVKGSVTVLRNATLVAGGVDIRGSVHARKAKSVSVIVESRIGGSVRVESSARAVVTASRIGGSVRLTSNRGQVNVARARVQGDVELVSNVGRSTVTRNDVGGDLRCSANRPPPKGSGNRVGGARRGQCARL
jgi:hypothetical protein